MGATKVVTGGKEEGVLIATEALDLVGFHGATPVRQRTNPMQHMSQGFPLGSLTSYAANVGAMANALTITTNDIAVTVAGIAANDMVIACNKPTAQAGMGVAGLWANATNTVTTTLTNPTAANVVPTANETWIYAAVRGFNTIQANFSAGAIVTRQTKEVEYTLGGVGAVATATTDGQGRVVSIAMSNQGSGYVVPPTVAIAGAPALGQAFSGTATGYGTDPANTTMVNATGRGATATPIISANGTITGCQVTNGGTGYPVNANNVAVTFSPGTVVAPGMVAAVNKMSAANAGVGICNVRVSGMNKIAVTYFNVSAANVTPANDLKYQIAAFNNLMPVSVVAVVSATLANLTATQANVANATAVAVPGIVATDLVINAHAAAANAGGAMNGGICSANTVTLEYLGGGNTTWTPANGVYNIAIARPTQPRPMRVIQVPVSTTTSIAANTTGEVVVALPANETFFAANVVPIVVNKPSHTPFLGVVGARAYDTGNLAITFQNVGTAAIVPPAETYGVAFVQCALPTVAANVLTGSYQTAVGLSSQQIMDLVNELQTMAAVKGLIAGS